MSPITLKFFFYLFYRSSYLLIKYSLQLSKLFLSQKTKNWIELRSDTNYLTSKVENPIWFHASSGEIEYCKSIIREIKKIRPEQKIIVSYSSSSAEKLFDNIKDTVDYIFPIPWDTMSATNNCLKHFKPKALIFSRTDFWPELIQQAKKQQVPLMAISIFPRLTRFNLALLKILLSQFQSVTTVNNKTLKVMQTFGIANIIKHSDTRFDQVFERLSHPSQIGFSSRLPRMVFASTWPEDEKIIFPLISSLLGQKDPVPPKLIICPHEPSRAQQIKKYFSKYKCQLLSECKDDLHIEDHFDLLIIDRVGVLADIYRYTDIAFVGGSFKQKIHSVMEPLCAGNIVYYGPCYANNPEALTSNEQNLSFEIKDSADFLNHLNLLDDLKRLELKTKIIEWTRNQTGSTSLITQNIFYQLKDKI
jgi:3-deoxy-D-manno-octulosonic-acid transferase